MYGHLAIVDSLDIMQVRQACQRPPTWLPCAHVLTTDPACPLPASPPPSPPRDTTQANKKSAGYLCAGHFLCRQHKPQDYVLDTTPVGVAMATEVLNAMCSPSQPTHVQMPAGADATYVWLMNDTVSVALFVLVVGLLVLRVMRKR